MLIDSSLGLGVISRQGRIGLGLSLAFELRELRTTRPPLPPLFVRVWVGRIGLLSSKGSLSPFGWAPVPRQLGSGGLSMLLVFGGEGACIGIRMSSVFWGGEEGMGAGCSGSDGLRSGGTFSLLEGVGDVEIWDPPLWWSST